MKKIGALSILHFFVDMLCAISIFSWFIDQGDQGTVALIYNFSAFALQMPLGAILDAICISRGEKADGKDEIISFIFTASGVLLTVVGAFTSVWILGIGNALFHVGGGVLSIKEDRGKRMNGRGLGVFVAPGAIGLYLGTQFKIQSLMGLVVDATEIVAIPIVLGIYTLILWFFLNKGNDIRPSEEEWNKPELKTAAIVILCCFICVIIRSYVGMASTFPWKTDFEKGLVAVIALAVGKMAGGFLGAKFGYRRTAIVSLALSGLCFILGKYLIFGLMALFLFNMTMPMTLYALARRMPETPGLAFGILTMGLFVGYLPWFGKMFPVPETWILGLAGSLISLLVLLPVLPKEDKW